jgi:hypothetical protein
MRTFMALNRRLVLSFCLPLLGQLPPSDPLDGRVWTSPEVLWYHFSILDIVALLVSVGLLLLFAAALYSLRDSIGKKPAKPDHDPDLDDTQDIPLSAVLNVNNVHNRTTMGS